MIRLVSSEALRITSRRLVWTITAIAAGIIFVSIATGTVRSHPSTAADEARAERLYQEELRRCLDGAYGVPPPPETIRSYCEGMVTPDMFQPSRGLRLSGLNGLIQGMSLLVGLLGIVLGASLVGADWSTGSMAILLTWEPRRIAVFVVRAVLVAVTVFVISVALLASFALWFRLGVALRGTATGSEGWMGDVAGSILRVGLVAVLYGSVAHAIASIGRSTAAGLGVVLGELILVEGFLRGFRPSIEPWLALTNAVVVVTGEAQRVGDRVFGEPTMTLTVGRAVMTLTAYALAALVVAAAVFRRRDVT